MRHEAGAPQPGDGVDPVGGADVGAELGGAAGAAGGTKALAGEAEEVLRGAAGTTDAGEAQVEDVTGEVWGRRLRRRSDARSDSGSQRGHSRTP